MKNLTKIFFLICLLSNSFFATWPECCPDLTDQQEQLLEQMYEGDLLDGPGFQRNRAVLFRDIKRAVFLKRLDFHFGGIEMSDETYQSLAAVVARLTFLKTLYMRDRRAAQLVPTFAQLHLLTKLQRLDVRDSGITSIEIVPLAAGLQALKQLKFLIVGSNPISTGIGTLAPALSGLLLLQELDLDSIGLTDDGASILATHILPLTELKSLRLSRNAIGAQGAQDLMTSCASMKLEKLNLNDSLYKDSGESSFNGFIELLGRLSHIESLSLGKSPFSRTELLQLARVSVTLPNLSDLNLFGISALDFSTGIQFATIIRPLEQLKVFSYVYESAVSVMEIRQLPDESKEVRCQGMVMSDGELAEFATSLNRFRQLQSFYFMLEIFGESSYATFRPFLPVISTFSQLTSLYLSFVYFGDEGAIALSQIIGNITKLTHLTVRDCEITAVGATRLVSACKDLPLVELDFQGNRIKAVCILVEALSRLSNLESIRLSSNPINAEDSELLKGLFLPLRKLAEIDLFNTPSFQGVVERSDVVCEI